MSSIREVIDPNRSLPRVELRPIRIQEWKDLGLAREKMAIFAQDEQVGECDIFLETDTHSPVAHFDGIEISEEKRGRGIGMAAYLLAIELAHSRGLPFETQNYHQTADSKKIWETLAAKGVAMVLEPFQPSKIRADRFEGRFRVPVPED